MRKFVVYLLSLPGYLPFWVLYLLSDIMYLLLRLVGYRKKVILRNLTASFPDMSKKELERFRNQFYHRLTDYFVETLKLAHISEKSMKKHMVFENQEVIDDFIAEGRSVVIYFSHCFNWEWATTIDLWSRYRTDDSVVTGEVYRPLRNKIFDELFLRLRERFGPICIPKRNVMRQILHLQRAEKKKTIIGFMSDQRPSHLDPDYEIEFLGQSTLVITGTEMLARKLNQVVVYWDIKRVSRGHYSIETKVITDNPASMDEGAITREYFQLLETTIRRDPANWLWSHKRWRRYEKTTKR